MSKNSINILRKTVTRRCKTEIKTAIKKTAEKNLFLAKEYLRMYDVYL